MITSLSLENFKSFKSLDNLKIKPLTILLGRNSCGKSSIIQSLLLLKQTISEENDSELNVEGKYLKFSSLKDISYGVPKINQAAISYRIGIEKSGELANIDLEFKNKKYEDSYIPKLSKFIYSNNKIEIDFKKISHNVLSKNMKNILSDVKKNKKFKDIKTNGKLEALFKNFMPINIRLKDHQGFVFPIYFAFDEIFLDTFYQDLRKIKYLSPIRANPERIYIHYSNNALDINENGANSAHVLWSKKNEIVEFNNEKLKLLDALHSCIAILGLGQEISSEKISEMVYQIGLKIKDSNAAVSLADVGFGYSQVLPVILLGLLNNNDNLLLIEQPEIHLHPSSASKLADLFLMFIKGKKKFIIETHSQELINKLRLRVIENPLLKEYINIVFIDQDENGTQIKQFEIDETGMFPEWPRGFLDESENIAREILKARVKSRNA
ncbi:DUF3696 domain-containing protein [Acinetobacter corruptisaponis]|uniref:DUF3696 domain-containing protein n=1 Tax=Acinetobacter corruptisaponis TaxID=3045147 RepID=A0ABY8S159_9GAMM|nr:DUF3696 domain-containing protein [Acinetobacter sp. KCTC 92772]WHP04478.1 DUF3696 domain-containing protein [Acinetobacter sp. KCTC 92772]